MAWLACRSLAGASAEPGWDSSMDDPCDGTSIHQCRIGGCFKSSRGGYYLYPEHQEFVYACDHKKRICREIGEGCRGGRVALRGRAGAACGSAWNTHREPDVSPSAEE